MIKIKNRFFILLLLSISCITLGFLAVLTKADTISDRTFTMINSDSIRLSQGVGIRFSAELDKDTVQDVYSNDNKSFGMIIAPDSYFQIDNNYYNDSFMENITANHTDVTTENGIVEDLSVYSKSDKYYISGSIIDLKFKNLNTEFNGIAFIKTVEEDNSVSYVYADKNLENSSRSLTYIASCAIGDENADFDSDSLEILNSQVKNGVLQALDLPEETEFPLITADFQESCLIVGDEVDMQYVLTSNDITLNMNCYSKWSTEDTSILTISPEGNVIALAEGEATVKLNVYGVGEFTKTINVIEKSENLYVFSSQNTIDVKKEAEKTAGTLSGTIKYKCYNDNTIVSEETSEILALQNLPVNTALTLKVYTVEGDNEILKSSIPLFIFDGTINTYNDDYLFDYTDRYSNVWWQTNVLSSASIETFTDDNKLNDTANKGKTGSFLKLTWDDSFPFEFTPQSDVSMDCLGAFNSSDYQIEYDVLLSGDQWNFNKGFNSKGSSVTKNTNFNNGFLTQWETVTISVADFIEIEGNILKTGDVDNNYLVRKQAGWRGRSMTIYFSNLRIVEKVTKSDNLYVLLSQNTLNVKEEAEKTAGTLSGTIKYKCYNDNTIVSEETSEVLALQNLPVNTELTLKVYTVENGNETLKSFIPLYVFDGTINTYTTDYLSDYTERYANYWWKSNVVATSSVETFTDDNKLNDTENNGKTGSFLKLTWDDSFPFEFTPQSDVSMDCLGAFNSSDYQIEYDVLLSGDQWNFNKGFNSKGSSVTKNTNFNNGFLTQWETVTISVADYIEIEGNILETKNVDSNYLVRKQAGYRGRTMTIYFSNLRVVKTTV